MLRSAEKGRNSQLQKLPPERFDENGKAVKDTSDASSGKTALTYTAFAIAAGAVILRIGGRAALISAVGLDFAKENPELQEQLNQVLDFASSMGFLQEALAFVAAWTAVKVFCFDAGGVVLALSAGLLFGGVFQGAFMSAFSATVGSSICFGLAQLDSPIRKQALKTLDDFPSLRGIEKVVAKDGFKAILTLRLAPILPIPLGLYNYVYGVTNVPFLDFASGIFLGSLKPYLFDSYLGYFGKTIIDGSAASGGEASAQDFILLFAVGFSVLIGVFASQLASETWDTVAAEVEAEKKAKEGTKGGDEENDGVVRKVFGIGVPEIIIGLQLNLKMADERINEMIDVEFDAKLWNYTKPEEIPVDLNPAYQPSSPEAKDVMQGVDFGRDICDGMVLSPILFFTFFKLADPYFDEQAYVENRPDRTKFRSKLEKDSKAAAITLGTNSNNVVRTEATTSDASSTQPVEGKMPQLFVESPNKSGKMTSNVNKQELLRRVKNLRSITEQRLEQLDSKLKEKEEESVVSRRRE